MTTDTKTQWEQYVEDEATKGIDLKAVANRNFKYLMTELLEQVKSQDVV